MLVPVDSCRGGHSDVLSSLCDPERARFQVQVVSARGIILSKVSDHCALSQEEMIAWRTRRPVATS